MARIGILGGSFDPLHTGHLLLAECCREQCALDKVLFIPTAISPLKEAGSHATNQQRLDMLTLGIAGQNRFEISDLELRRGGKSYTYETLETLTADNPQDEFYFLMGADSLADFSKWKEPQRICELATLAIVSRPGCPPLDFQLLENYASPEYIAQVKEFQVAMPAVDLSSSEIRQKTAYGKSIRYHLPRSVEQYIRQEQLYQTRD